MSVNKEGTGEGRGAVRGALPEVPKFGVLDRLVGRSDAIDRVRLLVRQVAPTKISVLISGESGTGKEVIARLIHDLSQRRDARFVPVNCGAIPEGLFESEMFGHERGSFTGAERARKGYFEQADKGTLFLDEVGEMPLEMQVKVLRALESGEYYRVGADKASHADVRVIAASNRDLEAEVERGRFREDLYYRLRVVEIHLPPLRERREDIPLLVDRFAELFSVESGIPRSRILPDAMEVLQNHEWKGNVRELRNFVETLLTLEYPGPIDAAAARRHLPHREGPPNLPVLAPIRGGETDRELILQLLLDLRRDVAELKNLFAQAVMMGRFPALPEQAHYTVDEGEEFHRPTLEEVEREQIRRALLENKGNRRKAAKELGIGERTLYRKIKEYNL